MIQFKLNSKKVEIPSTWYDLTMKQYLSILNGEIKDTTDMIALFTGIDSAAIKKATIIGLDKVIASLGFLNTVPVFEGICEKVGAYKLPIEKGKFNIQFESLAQFEDMRAIIKTCADIKSITNAYPKIVAIYLQKIRDGEYDYTKAQQMADEVLTMPVKEVVTVGAFFYVKLMSLLLGTPATSPHITQSPKKSKQGSRNSVKRSARR
jgi:hypothetical protein